VLGLLAWMQNMYSAPIPVGFLYFAMLMAVALVVPVGLILFNWIATLRGGTATGKPPMRFALAAVTIATVGVFGVMSQAVTERGREIAVRMALGAGPRTIVSEFLAEAGWMTLVALGVGLGIALLATRALAGFLYGIAPLDGVSLFAAGALVVVLALFAAALPSWRAARTNPARVLQDG
jgi:ABC-type lipoprotein release transport system permease subunit